MLFLIVCVVRTHLPDYSAAGIIELSRLVTVPWQWKAQVCCSIIILIDHFNQQ